MSHARLLALAASVAALCAYLEATSTSPTQDPTTRDATRALRGKVDEARLAERYRKILAAID